MPYVVPVPILCVCLFLLSFSIDWPPHGGPCRRTWTDIVGRPGSGNRCNCTNAMGARVDLLASTAFNKLPLPPTASMTAPRSRIRPRPRSSCIMAIVICARARCKYIRISGDEFGGTMHGRSLPIPRMWRLVLSASHPPFPIDTSTSPMLVALVLTIQSRGRR